MFSPEPTCIPHPPSAAATIVRKRKKKHGRVSEGGLCVQAITHSALSAKVLLVSSAEVDEVSRLCRITTSNRIQRSCGEAGPAQNNTHITPPYDRSDLGAGGRGGGQEHVIRITAEVGILITGICKGDLEKGDQERATRPLCCHGNLHNQSAGGRGPGSQRALWNEDEKRNELRTQGTKHAVVFHHVSLFCFHLSGSFEKCVLTNCMAWCWKCKTQQHIAD
ncbi:uncharacterized protein LOC122825524 [Gambusia affinis]|uniref:uncharacterized protein LOC122825524 n=1 Tax=Gambusia affinis TaxID=33528 RepID=UPI001CDCDF51|nr:uncharacterized protein LOC122825524 [Gambusia affinis]